MKLEDIALDAKMDKAMREKLMKEAKEMLLSTEKTETSQKEQKMPDRKAV